MTKPKGNLRIRQKVIDWFFKDKNLNQRIAIPDGTGARYSLRDLLEDIKLRNTRGRRFYVIMEQMYYQMQRENTPIPLADVERKVVLETLKKLHPNYDTKQPVHAIGTCYIIKDDGLELHLTLRGPETMNLKSQTYVPEEYAKQREFDRDGGLGLAVLYFENGKPGLELIGLTRRKLIRRTGKR